MMKNMNAPIERGGIFSLIKTAIPWLESNRWLRRKILDVPALSGGLEADHSPLVPNSCPVPFRNEEYRRLVGQGRHCDGCGATTKTNLMVEPGATWHDTDCCFSLCECCKAHYKRLPEQERRSWQDDLARNAHTRGKTTVSTVNDRHGRIMQIAGETGCKNVMFDFLEAEVPSFEAMKAQHILNVELSTNGFRVAVVVPDSKLAYHFRMIFGEHNQRIVYESMAEAILWLTKKSSAE